MFFDLAGATLSLLSTYYFIRLNNKAWLVGIAATCLNGWLYWQQGIYADMMLEVVYFLSMGYGWYRWQRTRQNKTNQQREIGYLNLGQSTGLMVLIMVVFSSIYFSLIVFTKSTVAFLDATTTSLSLIAQGLMCHKIIVTWLLWFITDLLYALMYFNKHLPFHTGLMLVYTGMAVTGYVVWARQSKESSYRVSESDLSSLRMDR